MGIEDDEDTASTSALRDLVAKYPDFNMTLVSEVLAQCGHNPRRAYEILCEMVIPPETAEENCQPKDSSHVPAEDADRSDNLDQAPKTVTPPPNVHYTPSDSTPFPPEFEGLYQVSRPEVASSELNVSSDRVPQPSPIRAPQGAWAGKTMGRTYRVDAMCARYRWLPRTAVEGLFEKYGDCVELVENDILQMFPVDEPQAFGGGEGPAIGSGPVPGRSNSRISPSHQGGGTSQQQRAMAEALRQQAAVEIQRDALRPEAISSSSKGMSRLRRELWEARETRMRMQQLANQTRKAAHIAQAREKDLELRRLSEFFLARMRQSQEYKGGCIDLHGLTKEEALKLVEWKLEDSGRRRFRVITGRGMHSHNGQAVLRPALEKYFRSEGISFSMYEDGIMSVIP